MIIIIIIILEFDWSWCLSYHSLSPYVIVSTEFLYSSMMLSKIPVTCGINVFNCSICNNNLTVVVSGSPLAAWRLILLLLLVMEFDEDEEDDVVVFVFVVVLVLEEAIIDVECNLKA